ncbi:MAG: uracil phosphoribosyltransferase [Eubacteriales bacterium]|nr:uracil phosphoribosyltransferase [Eubacteriales bacterium]
MEEQLDDVFIFDHPLIQHKMSKLRDKHTTSKEFREIVNEISMLMAYEVTRDMPLREIEVETPICKTKAYEIEGKKAALIPILRAGLGMVGGWLELIPNAKVGHIGVYRDPQTFEAIEYYCKLPEDIGQRDVYLLDPMLATGVSSVACLDILRRRGVKACKFVCLIAAPEGIQTLREAYPDVPIYCAALDQCLNEHRYIVPGLGDAGDRLFGTK